MQTQGFVCLCKISWKKNWHFILNEKPMWRSWPWPVGGSIAPSGLVWRDPQKPHGWNAMLCASEPFTSPWPVHPAAAPGLEPTTTAFAFRSKVFQPRHPSIGALILIETAHISGFSLVQPFSIDASDGVLSPLPGVLRTYNFLTWQNGEKLTHRNLANR